MFHKRRAVSTKNFMISQVGFKHLGRLISTWNFFQTSIKARSRKHTKVLKARRKMSRRHFKFHLDLNLTLSSVLWKNYFFMCLPSAINLLLPFLLPSPQKLTAFRINFKCRLRGNYNNPSFLSLPTHIHIDTHTRFSESRGQYCLLLEKSIPKIQNWL